MAQAAVRLSEVYRLAEYPPFRAVAHEGNEACWLVLLCAPQQEGVAAAHLAARGFGAYLPEVPRKWSARPAHALKRVPLGLGREPMFPGYVFAFVFGIERNWRRILGCPGITGVLAPIGEPEIDLIRVVENEQFPLLANLDAMTGKKRTRRWRKSRMEVVATAEILAVRSWSAFADKLTDLDAEGRNGLLCKALGLHSDS